VIADYVAPSPPPGSGPHRYIFLLYNQPADFDGKDLGQTDEKQKLSLYQRVRFDFGGFLRDAKLGDIVAANWFVSD